MEEHTGKSNTLAQPHKGLMLQCSLGSDARNKTSIPNPEKEVLQKHAEHTEAYPHHTAHKFNIASLPLMHLNQGEQ